MIKLLPEQRAFFKQIADLAFVNPFSDVREHADCQLLNIPMHSLSMMKRADRILEILEYQLQTLQTPSAFRIDAFQKSDRETMKYVLLFYRYHQYQDRFNQFINDQRQQGDESMTLPFADELIHDLQSAGLNESEICTYIGLFYQLHRGFYFISSSLTGNSPSMVALRMRLWNNIFTYHPKWYLDYLLGHMEEFSTLLLGATGSGKSLVAKAIGSSGYIPFDIRKKKFLESFSRSFQAINLAQFPASLLESELFGHKKGAFTGAIENHPGIFARCSANGAVFIDEIGDIDIPTQVKLLNVIQDRTFSPVGSHEKLRFSGRVISATNRDIEQLRHDGLFRHDLYYRLCSDVIIMPSLHQRLQEDHQELYVLIESLLKRVIMEPNEKQVFRIADKIQASLPPDYSWPGNVRELEQCIRRICLTGEYKIELQSKVKHQQSFYQDPDLEISSQQLLKNYCSFLYDKHGSFEAVARITQMDRRTVKKYIID